MEKASNNNNSTKQHSNMLQKALSVGHSAALFSPARDFRYNRTASTANRGFFFSGPIISFLPTAAKSRRKTKKNDVVAEPTSPVVSCIGQIRLAKPKIPEKKKKAPNNLKTASSSLSSCVIKEEGKGSFSKLKRLFSTRSYSSSKSNATATVSEHWPAAVEPVAVAAAPSLGNMKKFASSREALGGFNWTVQLKREESQSDNRRGFYADDKDETIPCFVTIPLSQREGLGQCPKPKSEVNLWKRRTMDRPNPLQVKNT